MLETVILDDDVNSQNSAVQALKSYDDVKINAAFTKSEDFFNYLDKNKPDLVFLDIELANESGFDIARKLQEEYPEIIIIFLTGHASYAIDSFDFQPLFFLTKPINPEKLKKAMELVHQKKTTAKDIKQSKLMFKSPDGYRFVEVGKIDYIERRARKNIVVCGNEEFQIAYYTMSELMDMLEEYGFFMCHQSFIVALSSIEKIYDEKKQLYTIVIKNTGAKIPVSRKQYEVLRKLTEQQSLQRF